MQRAITRGAAADAGLIFHIFAQDSTSTTGAGKASIAFGDWACRYIRNGETISGAITPQDITTLGTYEAPTANTNIRIKAVDNTNMIGVYEVHIHADWVNTANTCQSLTIYLTATGVATLPIQVPLIGMNQQDSVRAGLTALPNAAADAAGGLPISEAGGLDLDSIKTDTAAILADTGTDGVVVAAGSKTGYSLTATTGLGNQTANITGNLSGSVGSVTGAVGSVTGAVGSVTAGVTLANGAHGGAAATLTLGGAGGMTGDVTGNVSGSVGSVTGAVGSVGANGITATSIAADAINADSVKADAVTKIQNGLATPTNITAGTITTVTNLTNAPTNGDLTATMKTSVTTACTASTPTAAAVTGAVGSVTGAVGSVTGNVGGNVTGSVGSVAANGLAAASVASAAAEKIADIVLRRGNASVEASSDGDALAVKSLYGAVAILTNGVDADTTPGTLSIKKAGGTELGTQTLTGDATADPVVKVVSS